MPLPDATLRQQLWRYHIPKRMPVVLSDSNWAQIVQQSAGLSGGDILNSVINAAARALEREGQSC